MFIGHFAVGFAAQRAAPKTTLGWLLAAPLLLDLIWPLFVLAGWERVAIDPGNTAFTPLAFVSYPLSHSLAAATAWASLAAAVYWAATRYRRGALVVGVGVLSHWAMDAVVHRPDLPLYPGSGTYAGLGLWNSVPATILVEGAIFAAGVWLYSTATRARDRIGVYAWWSLIVFVVAIYAANASGGPPPPTSRAVALVALAQWLFIPWAFWCDRHRIRPSEIYPHPWLSIPLADYEGHMRSPGVRQLDALAELFGEALAACRPESVAVLGLAGGNGLERIDPRVTRRVVGIDVNPEYLEAARRRFAALTPRLYCLDLAQQSVSLEPVELVHAALLFEHAGTDRCLQNAISLVAPGGALSVVLQLPGDTAPDVAPSAFPSIQRLAPHFSLVDPDRLQRQAARHGLRRERESRRAVPGGKALWMGLFRRR